MVMAAPGATRASDSPAQAAYGTSGWPLNRLGLSCIRLVDFAPKILDQRGKAGIARRNAGQSLGVFERGSEFSCVAGKADERLKGVAFAGMPDQTFFQHRHRFVAASR